MKPTSIPPNEIVSMRTCPYCSTRRLHLHEWNDGAYVHCECGAKGPPGAGPTAKIMAYDLWNIRQKEKEATNP
jgi:hypothetical protein